MGSIRFPSCGINNTANLKSGHEKGREKCDLPSEYHEVFYCHESSNDGFTLWNFGKLEKHLAAFPLPDDVLAVLSVGLSTSIRRPVKSSSSCLKDLCAFAGGGLKPEEGPMGALEVSVLYLRQDSFLHH